MFSSIFLTDLDTAWKVSKYGVFMVRIFLYSDQKKLRKSPYSEYSVNLRIQIEYRKIRTRKISVSGHFSRSGIQFWLWWFDVNLGVSKWFWKNCSWSVRSANNLKQNGQKEFKKKSLTTFCFQGRRTIKRKYSYWRICCI